MNNLLIEINKDNVLKKVFKCIKNFFMKKQHNEKTNKVYIEEKAKAITELYKVDNLDEINIAISNKYERQRKLEEIIKIIEENPDMLHKLDISKLEVIDNYYKYKIDKYKRRI